MPQKHKLRTARDYASLTQRELAEASHVSSSTISHIECHRGPDVPLSELRKTKTKLKTALKLLSGLGRIAPGEYTLSEFVAMQSIFTELEILEAVKDYQKREHKSKGASKRHLRLVA